MDTKETIGTIAIVGALVIGGITIDNNKLSGIKTDRPIVNICDLDGRSYVTFDATYYPEGYDPNGKELTNEDIQKSGLSKDCLVNE